MKPETPTPSLLATRLLPKLWGGRRLAAWGKALPPGQAIGESWEQAPPGAPPILLKLIDAAQDLSVQVHPDDDLARELHGPQARGKSEMWVVLEAAPGARVLSGFKPGTTPRDFEAALAAGAVEGLLNAVPVAPGDVIDIPAGRVHAIGAGCLLAEVQQDSDWTYRVWDYGRLERGRPRELHLDWARRALRFDALGCADGRVRPEPRPRPWGLREALVANPHFGVERWSLRAAAGLPEGPARLLLVLDGVLRLAWGREEGMMVPKGSAAWVPGACALRLEVAGACTLLSAVADPDPVEPRL